MSIGSIGSKISSAFHLKTPGIEKKALPPNPIQNPALRASSLSVDSFEAGPRPGSRPSGGASLSGDVFQSATQASGTQAALELLGDIGEKVSNLAEDLGEVLSKGGAEGDLSADGPEDDLSADGPEGDLSADGPEDDLSANGPEDDPSTDGPED